MKIFRSYLARRPGAELLLTVDGAVIALPSCLFADQCAPAGFHLAAEAGGLCADGRHGLCDSGEGGLCCPDSHGPLYCPGHHGPLCCVRLGESRPVLASKKDAELGLSWLAGCCVNGVDSLFCPS